jgi:chemotaxis signal transduction protein
MPTAPRVTAGLVRLTAGPFAVALPIDRVGEVQRADRVHTDDGSHTLTTRGETIPVYPLADLLGNDQPTPPQSGQVVLVEHAGQRFGVWVERVDPLPRTAAPRWADAPRLGSAVPFAAVALHDDAPLPILDFDRLFGEQSDDLPPAPPRPATPRPNAVAQRLFVIGEFTYAGGRIVGFGLPVGCVDEITDVGAAARVPGVPSHVLGLIEWRGRAVPKVDAAAWCGLAPLTQDHPRVAVIRTSSGDRVAVATGPTVTALPFPLPHTAGRLQLPLKTDRIFGTIELSGRTLVLPRWNDIGAHRAIGRG